MNQLTLEEWSRCSLQAVVADDPHPGCRLVYADEKTPYYRELWALKDYVVSSLCGPVVWLIPRIVR